MLLGLRIYEDRIEYSVRIVGEYSSRVRKGKEGGILKDQIGSRSLMPFPFYKEAMHTVLGRLQEL